MKIALWAGAFPPSFGGVESCSELLAVWLAGRGHSICVLTPTQDDGKSDRERPYRVVREPSPTATRREMRAADVVQIVGLSARAIVTSWAVGKRPVVSHVGPQAVCPEGLAWSRAGRCDAGPRPGPCGVCPTRGALPWVNVRAHRLPSKFGAANVFCSRYLRGRVGLEGEVIYNPVARAAFLDRASTDDERPIILAVGRLVNEKGFDLLVRSLPLIADSELVVAGDGPLRRSLESLSAELRVAHRVRFVGRQDSEQLGELRSTSTVVCMPTLMGEAFGYVLAEAMASHLSAVGTPAGAVPELLGDRRGYVASGMTPKELAASIQAALDDSVERRARADAAHAFALRELHVDVVGTRYEELFERCAS